MRILSQDGKIDVNYDLGNLSIASGRCEDVERASIYFHSCSCANATRLAEYTSLDKARKAMEMLHNAYMGMIYAQNTQLPEGGVEELKEMAKHGFGILYAVKDTDSAEFKPLNICFQFPQDSEIEV